MNGLIGEPSLPRPVVTMMAKVLRAQERTECFCLSRSAAPSCGWRGEPNRTFRPARERYGLSLCCVAVRMVARPLSAAMSYAPVENTKEFLPPPMSALGH